jgi:GDP-4-dehydro-6-deoxy-D-mannose reductase
MYAKIMKRVMVTGVNGFVGKHLVQALYNQDCEVIGVGREPETTLTFLSAYYVCDLTDTKAVSALPLQNITAIINLAGLAQVGASFGQEALYKKVNVDVLKIIGEELLRQRLSMRLVAISTGAVYDPHQTLPLNESSKLISDGSPYAMSKIMMEQVAQNLQAKGLNVVVMRPFNHIGPGQEGGFLVPDLYQKITYALKNHEPVVTGDLTTRRDYTDVRDVVRAYTKLALALPSDLTSTTYNVCSGISRSGKDILDTFKKYIPGANKLSVTLDPSLVRLNDPQELVGSNKQLNQAIHWKPEIPMGQTIKDFIASRS